MNPRRSPCVLEPRVETLTCGALVAARRREEPAAAYHETECVRTFLIHSRHDPVRSSKRVGRPAAHPRCRAAESRTSTGTHWLASDLVRRAAGRKRGAW